MSNIPIHFNKINVENLKFVPKAYTVEEERELN